MASKKGNVVSLDGEIVNVSSGFLCDVLLENGVTVQAALSGNMRRHSIRVSVGDRVQVEMSPNSPNLGRVVLRY